MRSTLASIRLSMFWRESNQMNSTLITKYTGLCYKLFNVNSNSSVVYLICIRSEIDWNSLNELELVLKTPLS